ncbi:MAG: DnaJ C-terminal domain-containing protein [Reichenbachiella sp.]|uniref:J domain-containing protein n=1 Tax=Reichenbachiella sp. TaxID=2184521 RepID=UPI0032665D89
MRKSEKKYDELGQNWRHFQQGNSQGDFDWSQWQQNQPGGGSYSFEGDPTGFGQGDFSDFFNNIFGGRATGRERSQSAAFKGQDYQTKMDLTLEEAYHGTTKILQLHDQKIRMTLKPGVRDEQNLRVRGKGAPGINGGPAGDLYVRIHIPKHHLYQRKGANLEQTVNVDLYTAILGGKVQVNTFTGSLNVTIPAGTQNDKLLRLKEKGMPVYQKKGKFGDMLARVKVKIPTSLSSQEKELFKELKEISNPKSKSYV